MKKLTAMTVEELENLRRKMLRKASEADSRLKDIDQEFQSRRLGEPVNRPYPWTDAEREYLRRDKERYGE